MKPLDQSISLYLRPFVVRLNLHLLTIDQLPFLLLHGHKPRLQFVSAEYDGKWYFITFTRCELRRQFRFSLGQEIRLMPPVIIPKIMEDKYRDLL